MFGTCVACHAAGLYLTFAIFGISLNVLAGDQVGADSGRPARHPLFILLREEEKMLNMRELMPWSRGREPATARRFEHPLMAFQKEVDRLFDEF